MKTTLNQLSEEAQSYINGRFAVYGISGEEAYNDNTLFPNEVKELNSDEIIEILRTKDISHVMPKSQYPELESDINNIILEDSSINRSRGAEIMTENEIDTAQSDYYNDIQEFEDNIEFLDALPDVLMGSTAIGLGLSSAKAYQKVKEGGISLNEAPRFILVDAGGKIVKCAIIGVCLSSGAPVLVAGGFAYTLYKAKDLIKASFNGVWKIASHPITVDLAKFTGVIAINIVGTTAEIIGATGKKAWEITTHETTKKIAKEIIKTTGKAIYGSFSLAYNMMKKIVR